MMRNIVVAIYYYIGHIISLIMDISFIERIGGFDLLYPIYNHCMTRSCMLDKNNFMWEKKDEI